MNSVQGIGDLDKRNSAICNSSDTYNSVIGVNILPASLPSVSSPVFIANGSIQIDANWTTNVGWAVSASWEHSAPFSTFKAFDKITTTSWATPGAEYKMDGTVLTTAQWIQMQFPQEYILTSFTIKFDQQYPSWQFPTDWAIQGSNDNISFTELQTYTQSSWITHQTYTFTVSSRQSFKYWRIKIYKVSPNADPTFRNLCLEDIQFFVEV